MWYPENQKELNELLDEYLNQELNMKIPSKINGIIVPHAGYIYSGAVAGTAYSLLKSKRFQKAIVIGPSHYTYTTNAETSVLKHWRTPLGKIEIFNENFPYGNLDEEHSIKNQVPFLQKLNVEQLLPLMVGDISDEKAKEIADKISKINALYVFSTDLSHFLPYDDAKNIDKETIEIIESLDIKKFELLDACGHYPLLILFHLCEILKTKPHLIEYKNSGDVIGDKRQVVGYASFYF